MGERAEGMCPAGACGTAALAGGVPGAHAGLAKWVLTVWRCGAARRDFPMSVEGEGVTAPGEAEGRLHVGAPQSPVLF